MPSSSAAISRRRNEARWNSSGVDSGVLAVIVCRFPQDVAKVSLEIFLHRTAFAVPFRALIGRGGQSIVGATEKILPER